MDITTVLTYLKGLIPTIFTLLMMLSPAFSGELTPYKAENPDELIASFAVVSDIHVETNRPESYEYFKKVLEGIKGGEDIDAAIYTGDNVMNGQFLENMFFYLGVKGVNPAENNFAVMGNHDIGNGTGDFQEHRNNFITNNRLFFGNNIGNGYYYRVINGCYLIFIASEDLTVGECVMSKTQYDWLKDVLDEAAAKDAPTIVFNHHPADAEYFRSIPEGALSVDALSELLNDYDVLYVHGHIHNELTEDSFYEYNGVKSINLPRCTETTDYEPGDGIVIEVYEDEIVVRSRDFIAGEWIDGLRYEYAL